MSKENNPVRLWWSIEWDENGDTFRSLTDFCTLEYAEKRVNAMYKTTPREYRVIRHEEHRFQEYP